jgi:hypothetical protein
LIFKNIVQRKTRVRILLFTAIVASISLIVWLAVRAPQTVYIDANPPKITVPASNLPPITAVSVYPKNTPNPVMQVPPMPSGETEADIDPYKIIERINRDQADWLEQEKTKPGVRLLHDQVLPKINMNLRGDQTSSGFPENTIWLDSSQPFQGVVQMLPFYPLESGEPQTFIYKALLDGREIRIGIKGQPLSDRISLRLKSGERSLFEFETEPLPLGIHNLSILTFYFADDITPDSGFQNSSGYFFRSDQFKVYVGKTDTQPDQPTWYDWSVGTNLFPHLLGLVDIIDVERSKEIQGFAYWQPDDLQPKQQVNYQIGIVNGEEGDREYCLIAFLDYKVVPIQDGKDMVCGVVRQNQWGIVNATLTAPVDPGVHHLEVVRIENPLMKESYMQTRPKQQLSQYNPTGRVLINVKADDVP